MLAVEKAGLTDGELVLDAYCGIGIMTMLMARHAGRAVGVEIVPNAVMDARAAARRNNINNVSFEAGDCARLLPQMLGRGLMPGCGCSGSAQSRLRQAAD